MEALTMKHAILATAGLLALAAATSPAAAADLPPRLPVAKAPAYIPPSVYNWTGFYIGVNGGYGWGQSEHSDTLLGVSTGDFDLSGGLVGGTVGFNYQAGPWVWGLEGDLDWANIQGTSGTFLTGAGLTSYATELRWLSTVRGRLGYAFDRVLPYVTGGLAVGDVRADINTPGATATGSNTQIGWTVGAGVEYGITPNVTAKIEYNYVDLGSSTPILADSVDFRAHVVRGGVNWKFDWGGPGARY
jgi:outer membrane immunogenic protein